MRGPFSTPITPLPGSFFHADPQISSTSEQLAEQAEDLQEGISFFRMESDAARPRTAPARKAAAPAKPPVKATRKPVKARTNPGSVVDQQTRVRGFALDLAQGGADGEDAEFGHAA